MEQFSRVTKSSHWHRIGRTYQEMLTSLLHSPAAWVFAAAWLLSVAYLLSAGYGGDIFPAFFLVLLVVVLSLLTLPLTGDAPPTSQVSTARARLWVQLSIVLLCVLFTGYRGLLLNGAISLKSGTLPFVTPLIVYLAHFPLDMINPLLYFALPMLLLWLTGIGFREVGFARGYRNWAVTLLWCTPLLVMIAVSLLTGGTRLSSLGLGLLHNSLRNGFFEEFLFRGALMAILILLWNRQWAIVLSSLLFGLWHLGTNTASFDGNFLAGAAFGVMDQAVIGLGFAVVVYRTRNLLASSIIHVLFNTAIG